jgi:hypothetical protein
MSYEAIGDPIEDRILVQERRRGPSWRTMLRKTRIIRAASAVLCVAAIAPNVALAFGPPPPPPALAGAPPRVAGPPSGLGGLPRLGLGGPPHLSAGGPPHSGPGGPPALSNLGGSPGLRSGGHGQGDLRGRSASNSYSRSVGNSYGRSAGYNYSRNGARNRYYGVYVNGNDGSSYADNGCHYTYSSRRHSRVVVCSED